MNLRTHKYWYLLPLNGDISTLNLEWESFADYYPFGMKMPDKNGGSNYRYAYQGKFAEKDDETGLLSFEARMYDSRIGRWFSPDPAGQFYNPYISMANNPISYTDSDGRWVHIAAGAVIGAGISAVTVLSTSGVDGLMSGKGAAKVLLGAATGGLIAATGGAASTVGFSVASNVIDQKAIERKDLDVVELGVTTVTSVIGYKQGSKLAPKVRDFVQNKAYRNGWNMTKETLGGALEKWELKWWARTNTSTAVTTNLLMDSYTGFGNATIPDEIKEAYNGYIVLPEVVVTAGK